MLILTTLLKIEHAVHEWSNGTFRKTDFTESASPGGLAEGTTVRYHQHVTTIQRWERQNADYRRSLRKKWLNEAAYVYIIYTQVLRTNYFMLVNVQVLWQQLFLA